MTREMVHIHFLDNYKGTVLARKGVYHVPRKGDEIRLCGNAGKGKFFKVTRVVWCYDEPDCNYGRVNIGVKAI